MPRYIWQIPQNVNDHKVLCCVFIYTILHHITHGIFDHCKNFEQIAGQGQKIHRGWQTPLHAAKSAKPCIAGIFDQTPVRGSEKRLDKYKDMKAEENRRIKSSNVKIRIENMEGNFSVLDNLEQVKYTGYIHKDDHFCSCPSFENGNTEDYTATHGFQFECKHVMRAKVKFDTPQAKSKKVSVF